MDLCRSWLPMDAPGPYLSIHRNKDMVNLHVFGLSLFS